eukprot:10164014-Alexandrium_andersonii.AAC.1
MQSAGAVRPSGSRYSGSRGGSRCARVCAVRVRGCVLVFARARARARARACACACSGGCAFVGKCVWCEHARVCACARVLCP